MSCENLRIYTVLAYRIYEREYTSLYIGALEPMFLYGCELWWRRMMGRGGVRSLQRNCCLGLSRVTAPFLTRQSGWSHWWYVGSGVWEKAGPKSGQRSLFGREGEQDEKKRRNLVRVAEKIVGKHEGQRDLPLPPKIWGGGRWWIGVSGQGNFKAKVWGVNLAVSGIGASIEWGPTQFLRICWTARDNSSFFLLLSQATTTCVLGEEARNLRT